MKFDYKNQKVQTIFTIDSLKGQKKQFVQAKAVDSSYVDSIKNINHEIRASKEALHAFRYQIALQNRSYKYDLKAYHKSIGIYKYNKRGKVMLFSGIGLAGVGLFGTIITSMGSHDVDRHIDEKQYRLNMLPYVSMFGVGSASLVTGFIYIRKYKKGVRVNPYTLGLSPLYAPDHTVGVKVGLQF